MLAAALTTVRQIMQTCAALSTLIENRPLAIITWGVMCPHGRVLLHDMITTLSDCEECSSRSGSMALMHLLAVLHPECKSMICALHLSPM